MICSAEPGSTFTVAGTKLTVSEMGTAQFGLSTRAPSVVGWSHGSGAFGDLQIAERQVEYREISGFDCDKVDARSAEQKAHASRSWVKKQDSFASFNPGPGALEGFVKPADAPTSSPFGPTRKYTGVSKVTGEPCESTSVHRGYDMAAPVIDTYAKLCRRIGESGAGQMTKMCNQIAIAGLVQGLSEALHFAEKAGLDAAP